MSEPTKKITVKEFKMWLEGVEEMQDDDWTPDHRQWQRIREKIDIISEESPAQSYALPPAPHRAPPGPAPMQQLPMMPSTIPAGSSSLAGAPVSVPRSSPLATGAGNMPVKTPDIDTSAGGYESSFV